MVGLRPREVYDLYAAYRADFSIDIHLFQTVLFHLRTVRATLMNKIITHVEKMKIMTSDL